MNQLENKQDDDKINDEHSRVLFVGVTQHGKSALINKILQEYGSKSVVLSGNGHSACTKTVNTYTVDKVDLIDTPGLGEISDSDDPMEIDRSRFTKIVKLIGEQGISSVVVVVNRGRYNANSHKKIIQDYLNIIPRGVPIIIVQSGDRNAPDIHADLLPTHSNGISIDSLSMLHKLKIWWLKRTMSGLNQQYPVGFEIEVPICLKQQKQILLTSISKELVYMEQKKIQLEKECNDINLSKELKNLLSKKNVLLSKLSVYENCRPVVKHQEKIYHENNTAYFMENIFTGIVVPNCPHSTVVVKPLNPFYRFEYDAKDSLSGVSYSWSCASGKDCHFVVAFMQDGKTQYYNEIMVINLELNEIEANLSTINGDLIEIGRFKNLIKQQEILIKESQLFHNCVSSKMWLVSLVTKISEAVMSGPMIEIGSELVKQLLFN